MKTTRSRRSPEPDVVDEVLASLRLAKEALAFLPPLPPGLRPVHIRILGAMDKLGNEGRARVSDINRALGAALPNTTRLINELVELGVVSKSSDESDKRVVLVQPTLAGERHVERYVRRLHGQLAQAFAEIGGTECLQMAEALRAVHAAMRRVAVNESAGSEGSRRGRARQERQ